jgi:cyclic pyranopterin phosphate synthase
MRLPLMEQSRVAAETGPRSIGAVKMLRLSVTDRCNFRCVYCMPEDGVPWLPKDHILSFEEIADVVRASVQVHGIRRFKITGGEPTVRHGLVDLVSMLRRIDGVQDLSMTTNGFRLLDLAEPLKQAGLDRITISIDSLDAARFRAITRTGDLATVLRGLDRVIDAGFTGTKINCVAMRGTNDDEFAEFARLSIDRPVTVRFIEYMPLGDSAVGLADGRIDSSESGPAGGCGGQDRGRGAFVSETEIRAAIEQQLGPLISVDRESESGVGPATVYRLAEGTPAGRIGFISAMSAPFCSTCNRLRLTADGVLRSCLFEGGEVPIRDLIRNTATANRAAVIGKSLADCVRLKPDVHSRHGNEQMSRIGG